MSLFTLSSALLTAAMAITSVQASPFSGLDTRSFNGLLARDLSGTSCASFVYGATNTVAGTICVSVVGNDLKVNYPNLTPVGGSYQDLHVIVQTTPITETAPGQFPYKSGNGYCNNLSGTCSIPVQDAWRACGLKLYIAVHASFKPDAVKPQETGWREGPCIKTGANGNCAKYFIFTTECKCKVVTKYEPITTSVVYTKTIYETHTATCTTTPADVVTDATCDDPKVGATKTVSAKTEIAGYTCPTPA